MQHDFFLIINVYFHKKIVFHFEFKIAKNKARKKFVNIFEKSLITVKAAHKVLSTLIE